MKKYIAILAIAATTLVACNDTAKATSDAADSVGKNVDTLQQQAGAAADTLGQNLQNAANKVDSTTAAGIDSLNKGQ